MSPGPNPSSDALTVNRAPVLTLWAVVVLERLGYSRDEALSLGRALAGLNAQSKGRRLGIFRAPAATEPAKKKRASPPGEESAVHLMGRAIPAVRTAAGVRAVTGGREVPAESAGRYLEGKFGENLPRVREAMTRLAASIPPKELEERAFALYEAFRPAVPSGAKGWGAAGVLDLARIRGLASSGRAKR
jgi:hypothetical protein